MAEGGVTAEEIVRSIRDQIAQGRIEVPALPEIVLRVREAVADPGRNLSDIARIVQADIPLAGRLLQIANSPLYAARRPADHVHAAVMRLGTEATRNLVESFALRRVFFSPNPAFRPRVEEVWRHSVQVGAIAYTLARITPGLDADRALLAGLVHDIGILSLFRAAEQWPDLLADGKLLAEILQLMRGEVGGYVLGQWGLGPDLVVAALEGESWWREAAADPDYCDVVLIAQIHAAMSSRQPLPVTEFQKLPAFNKFPIFRFGASSSVELLNEAQQEMLELEQLLTS